MSFSQRLKAGFCFGILAVGLSATAQAGNITSVAIDRSGDCWTVPSSCSVIAVTTTGDHSTYLDPDGQSLSIASGTYLAFLGYKYLWDGYTPGVTQITLTLGYDTSASRSATFSFGSLANGLSSWTRTSGDTGLYLGASGVTGEDRVQSGGGAPTPDRVEDAVLIFSDTSDVGPAATATPEPSSLLLMAGGLLPLAWRRWKR